MKAFTSVALLLCVALALPSAYGQVTCGSGFVQVCLLGQACVCALAGGGAGDPIMRDFLGNKFEFFGEPGSFYNMYSDNAHQINMGLFPGFVDGHNGTYMGEFGFSFHNLRVNVTLLQDGDLHVEAWHQMPFDSPAAKHVTLVSSEASHTEVGTKEGNTLSITTDPFKPNHGKTVDISSGLVQLNVWAVPAGVLDSHNVSQPAYLNFNLTLLSPPAGDVSEGIIGETLIKVVEQQKQIKDNLFAESLELDVAAPQDKIGVFDGKGLTNDYRVDGLFGCDFAFNRFGVKRSVGVVARRALMGSRFAALNFPLSN